MRKAKPLRGKLLQKRKCRPCFIQNGICYILLQNGKYAICDEDRYDEVVIYNWYEQTDGYVSAWYRPDVNNKGKLKRLHNLLYPEFKTLDHINHNKLDNRACNVRPVTFSQNSMNRRVACHSTTGYKGVCLGKYGFDAKIVINGKRIYLGHFSTAEDAAEAYKKAANENYKEFACFEKGDNK